MEEKRQEYLTEEQARTVKELFKKYLRSYKEKDANMTDQEMCIRDRLMIIRLTLK